jgi:predicted nuclease of predicted toxin-antitoxin system
MKLLLDEGLPFRTAAFLREAGLEATHSADTRAVAKMSDWDI